MTKHQQALIEMIQQTVGEPRYGAEIGVWKGELSAVLLKTFPDCWLVFVDPWMEWGPDDSYYKTHRRTGKLLKIEWDQIYEEASDRIRKASGQSTVFRGTSGQGSVACAKTQFDFVFIDANHSYESVRRDIELWLPLVRPAGLMAGHDYGGTYRGVIRAVNDAFGEDNLMLPGNRSRVWGYVVGEKNDA